MAEEKLMCKINCSGGCIECAPEEHCVHAYTEICAISNKSNVDDSTICPCDNFYDEEV